MKFKMKYSFCLLCCVFAIFATKVKCWTYDQQSLWSKDNYNCGGRRQSPITLNKNNAINSGKNIPGILFIDYKKTFPVVKITNNGHTADIVLSKPSNYSWPEGDLFLPGIIGGNLPDSVFIAEGIHFHWGDRNKIGSEHRVNNHSFTMEMHIVHRNTKYRDINSALLHRDGLAVLAVLFSTFRNLKSVSGMTKVINALPAIQSYEAVTEITDFSVFRLIDSINSQEFYSYQGSLTTPPCSEAVHWTVFSTPVRIGLEQINEFRKLLDHDEHKLVNNYRHTQRLNGRKINFRDPSSKSWFLIFSEKIKNFFG